MPSTITEVPVPKHLRPHLARAAAWEVFNTAEHITMDASYTDEAGRDQFREQRRRLREQIVTIDALEADVDHLELNADLVGKLVDAELEDADYRIGELTDAGKFDEVARLASDLEDLRKLSGRPEAKA